MKKIFLSIILITAALFAEAQFGDSIIVGKKLSMYSNILKENRKIWVYAPNLTASYHVQGKRYPVLYLLDGNAHFLSTVGIIQQLSQANGNAVLPEMIVVGVENSNRLRDLTPSIAAISGKEAANPFGNFLAKELIPYIDRNYNTAPYKVLAGHSLGGLTTIDILTNNPGMFNAYIAIDPSMWYENEQFLNNVTTLLPTQKLENKRLFIGIANTMPRGMTLSKLKKDKSAETQHIRSILKVDKFLKSNSVSSLKYTSKYYENDSHNSVPLISEYDALRFIFDYYFMQASEKDFADSTAAIAKKLETHFNNISKEMGYKVAPLEAFINYLGYDALGKKQFSKAEALLKLNVENYPNSANVYDSYGDYLTEVNETGNAISFYKKALAIKEDAAIRSKLNSISQKLVFTLSENELQKYTGEYILEVYKVTITLVLQNGKLYAKVAGQADSEFVPVSTNVFTVRDKQGYKITFDMKEQKPVSFTSVQPDGIFKAILKN